MFPSRRATMGGDVFRDEFSLAFDGTTEYVDASGFGSNNVLSEDDAFTIGYWFKSDATDASPHANIVLGGNSAGYGNIFRFGPNPNTTGGGPEGGMFIADNRIGNVVATDGDSITNGTDLCDNKWHHAVLTRTAGSGKTNSTMYVDGVKLNYCFDQDDSAGGYPAYNSHQLQGDPQWGNCTFFLIGAEWDSGPSIGDYFKGNISEIFVYNKELTASQVKTLYNGREPYNHKEGVCSSNLQAWWRMGDGVFDTKQNTHSDTGIVSDETNATLGSDLLGGKGDFSDASYWTITSGQSIVEDNVGKFLGNDSFGQIKRNSLLTVGKIYRCQLDCTSNAGTTISLNQEDPYPQVAPISGTGTFFCFFKAHVTHFTLFAPTNSYGEAAIIDNVILQEVNGNAGAMINIDTTSCFEGDTP